MPSLPSLFISHGAPNLPLAPSPAREFLRHLGHSLPRPQAILVISAHWQARVLSLSSRPQQYAVHDFGGFPEALYRLRYEPPGAPDLAVQVAGLLEAAGFSSRLEPQQGLDHGAWVPLLLAYPEAEVPVLQLSLQRGGDPAWHEALGQAIAPLRHQGVLILASGSVTHNLAELSLAPSPPPTWARQFSDWLTATIEHGDRPALRHYRQLAPAAYRSHPTEEHLLPLFVALGAGGPEAQSLTLHDSYTYHSLSMAAYAWGDRADLEALATLPASA